MSRFFMALIAIMAFQYDNTLSRQNSTPEKKNQSALQKVGATVDRKLTQKVLDFLDKI